MIPHPMIFHPQIWLLLLFLLDSSLSNSTVDPLFAQLASRSSFSKREFSILNHWFCRSSSIAAFSISLHLANHVGKRMIWQDSWTSRTFIFCCFSKDLTHLTCGTRLDVEWKVIKRLRHLAYYHCLFAAWSSFLRESQRCLCIMRRLGHPKVFCFLF